MAFRPGVEISSIGVPKGFRSWTLDVGRWRSPIFGDPCHSEKSRNLEQVEKMR